MADKLIAKPRKRTRMIAKNRSSSGHDGDTMIAKNREKETVIAKNRPNKNAKKSLVERLIERAKRLRNK